MTVLLPTRSSPTPTLRSAPGFSRLAAWDHLRRRHLGLAPDPHDRSGTGFRHG
ncbi:hypothetical protein [Frankia sp. CcI49]|uniref:hypothetical protein n=1 Tax=Frankia sp. CcI49 TaxID=1745382 RepID=UPI00130453AF|nr:hypothetical protein [Frankia sp. CcI49]